LRSNRVNGRAGPSTDYPVRWVYRRRGLPVRVVAETETWRRIEDPDGAVVWVARHNLSPRRTAITRPQRDPQVAVRTGATSDARVVARLADGVIVDILGQRSGWVDVRTGDFRGWVIAAELWGA
jgi:SH3-like domain-containing protein